MRIFFILGFVFTLHRRSDTEANVKGVRAPFINASKTKHLRFSSVYYVNKVQSRPLDIATTLFCTHTYTFKIATIGFYLHRIEPINLQPEKIGEEKNHQIHS